MDDPADGFIYLLRLWFGVQILPPHRHDLGLSTIVQVQDPVSGLNTVQHVLGRKCRKYFGSGIFFRDFGLNVLEC